MDSKNKMIPEEGVEALRRVIIHCVPDPKDNTDLLDSLGKEGVRVAKYILGEVHRRETVRPDDEIEELIRDIYFNFC